MTRVLLVPGRGRPRRGHWLQRLADRHPDHRWAPEPTGPPYVLDERLTALRDAVAADDTPTVLVAHSAGCLTTVVWAARHTGPVRGALLVAPPYVEDDATDLDTEVRAALRRRLPFRAVLVASRTDPWATFAESERYARDWGAELVDLGDAGHVDTGSGYGPWPDAERLIAALAAGRRTRPTPPGRRHR